MKLTGQCKKDFQEWLSKQDYDACIVVPTHRLLFSPKSMFHFEQLQPSMQIGVLEDFFDQTKVINDFFIFKTKSNKYAIVHSGIIQKEEHNTREEARKHAITISNMIHNETNKDQSIQIEKICNSITRRCEGEKPITIKKKQERLYAICEKKNLTGNLKQLIENILNIA